MNLDFDAFITKNPMLHDSAAFMDQLLKTRLPLDFLHAKKMAHNSLNPVPFKPETFDEADRNRLTEFCERGGFDPRFLVHHDPAHGIFSYLWQDFQCGTCDAVNPFVGFSCVHDNYRYNTYPGIAENHLILRVLIVRKDCQRKFYGSQILRKLVQMEMKSAFVPLNALPYMTMLMRQRFMVVSPPPKDAITGDPSGYLMRLCLDNAVFETFFKEDTASQKQPGWFYGDDTDWLIVRNRMRKILEKGKKK